MFLLCLYYRSRHQRAPAPLIRCSPDKAISMLWRKVSVSVVKLREYRHRLTDLKLQILIILEILELVFSLFFWVSDKRWGISSWDMCMMHQMIHEDGRLCWFASVKPVRWACLITELEAHHWHELFWQIHDLSRAYMKDQKLEFKSFDCFQFKLLFEKSSLNLISPYYWIFSVCCVCRGSGDYQLEQIFLLLSERSKDIHYDTIQSNNK